MKKFSKRLLTFVLACSMVFGLSGMTAFATEVDEQDAAAGSEAIPEAIAEEEAIPLAGTATYTPDYDWYTDPNAASYTIESAEQLAALSEIVNGTASGYKQNSFNGQTIEIKKGIECLDMNEDAPVSWSCVYPDDANYNGVANIKVSTSEGTCAFTPIGNMRFNSDGTAVEGTYAFEGTFEGNGVTIKNLYVTGDEGYLGLFGAVGPADATKEDCDATVRNFTLSGVVECTGGNSNSQEDYVGGAVGKLNAGGTVEYVTNESLLVDAPGTDNVGGIVGFAGTPTGLGYDDNPSVSNTQVLCCENNAPVRAYYKVGGIVGENAATVKYCCNKDEGWIMCRRSSGQGAGVGGIVGRNGNNNTADEEALVAFCYNTGMITNNGRNDDSASNTIRGYAGICGTTYGATGKVETHNCYNIGAIPKGYGNYNSITSYIEDGAAVAVRDNYSPKDSTVINNAGNDVQETGNMNYTDANFKVTSRNSGDILYDLGAYFVADTTGKYNSGYPILFWETGEKTVPTITDLTITQWPNKTTYDDEVFNPSGMVVTATYSNGAEMEIQPAYATDGTNTYTLSDCYTYDYTKVLTTGDDHIDITFDGITIPVPINDGDAKNYISVSTSAGDVYQLSYSDINEALDNSDVTSITDAEWVDHSGKFVLVKDLLQTYLSIVNCEKITVSNDEGNVVTVPGEIYGTDENLYLYKNGTSYCLAGEYVPFDEWYENVSGIEVTFHDWGEPVWTWSDDLSYAEVTRTCQNTGCEYPTDTAYASIADDSINVETIDPGYRTVGATSYTATATFDSDGTTVEDTQNTDFKAATGYIDIAINRGGEEPETGKLWYKKINKVMAKTEPRTFTYTTGIDTENTVTKQFVSIADLLDITDTIGDVCCYHVTSGDDGGYEIDLPTYTCMYYRDDTLIYRTAVDGSRGNMWVDSPTSIEVRYQHDWGDLVWNWSDDYSSATVTGKCQIDVCENEGEEVKAVITENAGGNETIYTATATFSDGTVVTDTQTVTTLSFGPNASADDHINANSILPSQDLLNPYGHETAIKKG